MKPFCTTLDTCACSTDKEVRTLFARSGCLQPRLGRASKRILLTCSKSARGLFILLCFFALMLSPSAVFAQDESMEDLMFNILMDETYLSAEATEQSEQDAVKVAMSDLLGSVNEIRHGAGLGKMGKNSLQKMVKQLVSPADGVYHVLVYIPRTEAMHKTRTKYVGDNKELREDTERKNETTSSVKRKEPKEQKPEPPQTPKPEEPIKENKTIANEAKEATTASIHSIPKHYAALAAEFLSYGDAFELQRYMAYYKENGQLKACGGIRSLDDIPADAYKVLIRADDKTISAILSPENINMKTLQPDQISNYKGHQIVWYK